LVCRRDADSTLNTYHLRDTKLERTPSEPFFRGRGKGPAGSRGEIQHLWLDQALKVAISHLDDLSMRAGIEGDLLVLFQAWSHKDVQVVKITKGRHRSNLAIRKEFLEFVFRRERDVVRACDITQVLEHNFAVGGQHGHREPAIDFNNHRFSHFFS